MNGAKAADVWSAYCWTQVQREVRRLQNRIFEAYSRGDARTGQQLQRLLLKSKDAKVLAVRTVSELNRGRSTPGIDRVASLRAVEKLNLADRLSIRLRPRPVRRVYIPKAGSSELRPLGVPTMRDRAIQKLVAFALDPQIEVEMTHRKLDAYGFRIGRSRVDAIKAVRNFVDKKPGKYAAKCDIQSFFDRIDHEVLLEKIDTWPSLKRFLKKTLKAGIHDDRKLHPTHAGTPQGSPLSGILATWALLGLEEHVISKVRPLAKAEPKPAIIRYADDILIVHKNPEVLNYCTELVNEFLQSIGTELNREKSKVRCISEGVDFLGFHVRQFSRSSEQKRSGNGFVTIITPSKESVQRHYRRLADIVDRHKAKPQEELIDALNRVIHAWAAQYNAVNASRTFSKLDHLLYRKLSRWSRRRHGNKPWTYVRAKYWNGGAPWIFCPQGKEGPVLLKHRETKIRPRAKYPKARSPYEKSAWTRSQHPLARKYEEQSQDISDAWQDLRSEALSIEEPCEAKVTRTVLETSHGSDPMAEFNSNTE